ncbi:hypothetical protein PHYPSEUDO_003200 [Phytophthora pseudosyringae]|uniref:Uncharacterized protein n=1 Tax=Phytophthora pseudosyringae TaxID=221518 RepID=A0A8T1VRQ2_9STRA|nr:hypothetical protein PHYPSEUDO_003200 [Phytophthora pseudosyringae]
MRRWRREEETSDKSGSDSGSDGDSNTENLGTRQLVHALPVQIDSDELRHQQGDLQEKNRQLVEQRTPIFYNNNPGFRPINETAEVGSMKVNREGQRWSTALRLVTADRDAVPGAKRSTNHNANPDCNLVGSGLQQMASRGACLRRQQAGGGGNNGRLWLSRTDGPHNDVVDKTGDVEMTNAQPAFEYIKPQRLSDLGQSALVKFMRDRRQYEDRIWERSLATGETHANVGVSLKSSMDPRIIAHFGTL